ncbi:MAG: IS66 family transposase [Myxococcales bacterium]|nr:IS66 family transposase [Myxococcales bacterium]
MSDPRDAKIAEMGALLAKQQTLLAAQQKLIEDLQVRLAEREAEFAARAAKLESEVKRLERELLGPKTEKLKVPAVDRDDQPDDDERARRREQAAKKRRENALAKAAALLDELVDHPVEDKVCSKCSGGHFNALSPETSTVFEYVPGRFVRRVHRREKLVCSCGHIVTAPPPPKLMAGGRYGFGFAAFLVVEKCGDSIPIYRIEKRFARLGIPMSRATMNDILHAAAEVAQPLVDRIQARVAAMDIVLADETSMRLQDRPKRGFFWVFHGRDEQTDRELVLYVFAADRSGDTPARVLGGTDGTLVVDGYTGYNNVTDPGGRARAGCWCHLRRKLFEARGSPGDDADDGIDMIRSLFRVEHLAAARGIVGKPDHLALRLEKSKPVVDDFFSWAAIHHARALPKSPWGAALGYAINQRERLELFLTDPRIPLHNNASERRLRVIALGRKNYLFVGHPRAGRNIANLYSLVASCIANAVEPTAYLTDVLARVRDAKTDDALDALLPDRWAPQAASLDDS